MFALMRTSGVDRRLVAARALLAGLYGMPVAVEGWERLEPWAVARVLLAGPGTAPAVIVKWVRDPSTSPFSWTRVSRPT
jgi:hypothetical protein